ncbi:hypothetical protein J6590_056473 [Homalodisca vitripennis]|nr:hypothetical protein J6590_056473 [Homalodisca vitripennis]
MSCCRSGTMLAVVSTLLGLVSLTSALYSAISNHMFPCPTVLAQPDADIDKLLGPWHLSILVVDATEENFVESGVCVSGELQRYNHSTVRQVWTMQTVTTSQEEGEPLAVIEMPTTVIKPGVWAVHTPLGGEVKATVFESDPQAYMLINYCGWHNGVLVHLWTAAVTRSRILTPIFRRHLISLLEDHGFHFMHSKIVSWHGC